MKKQNNKIKVILFILSIIVALVTIWYRNHGFVIYTIGFISGCLSLMVLRTILWNTHELIKDKE